MRLAYDTELVQQDIRGYHLGCEGGSFPVLALERRTAGL